MRTTIVTPCTPSTMTRTITTRTICTSEHSSAPLVVFHVSLMMCHTTLAQVVNVSVISSSRHVYVRFSLTSSTSLSTSTCLSPSSSSPLSWCTLTCTPTSTTWTPWKITCTTPPRGALTPTPSPSPSQRLRHGTFTSGKKSGRLFHEMTSMASLTAVSSHRRKVQTPISFKRCRRMKVLLPS